jgi:hypothetical protein
MENNKKENNTKIYFYFDNREKNIVIEFFENKTWVSPTIIKTDSYLFGYSVFFINANENRYFRIRTNSDSDFNFYVQSKDDDCVDDDIKIITKNDIFVPSMNNQQLNKESVSLIESTNLSKTLFKKID